VLLFPATRILACFSSSCNTLQSSLTTLPVFLCLQESSCVRQLSSISSQDSGFVSHDVLLSSELTHNQDINSLSVLKVRYSANKQSNTHARTHAHTHTHPFNGPLSGTTRLSRYQKGKTYLDFTEARDNEWQWHQLGHMQVCTLLQTDNHASTHRSVFYRPDALPVAQPTVSKHWRQE